MTHTEFRKVVKISKFSSFLDIFSINWYSGGDSYRLAPWYLYNLLSTFAQVVKSFLWIFIHLFGGIGPFITEFVNKTCHIWSHFGQFAHTWFAMVISREVTDSGWLGDVFCQCKFVGKWCVKSEILDPSGFLWGSSYVHVGFNK